MTKANRDPTRAHFRHTDVYQGMKIACFYILVKHGVRAKKNAVEAYMILGQKIQIFERDKVSGQSSYFN